MAKVTEFNAETGETIVREMTENELAKYESQKAEHLQLRQAAQVTEAQKAAEKAALLAKLGITEDEAKLLLS